MNQKFRIGPWLIEPELNALSGGGKSIHVEPKVMEVLVCLAERRGKVIPQQELISTVWSDAFVTDDVLTRAISELHRVLDDDPGQPQFIETIPQRGYRLVSPGHPVEQSGANGDSPGVAFGPAASNSMESLPAQPPARSRPLLWVGAMLLVLGILAGALLYAWRDLDAFTR